MRLLLASASPRRAELLHAAGFAFDVDPMGVDEARHPGEAPADYVTRVARLKAEAGAARHPRHVVVGADTAVVVGEVVLGKPADEAEARAMLGQLSGRPHEVLTAVSVIGSGEARAELTRTTVWFRSLTDMDITWLVASGEPMDKAGGYAIQGRAARFIPHIEGSYSNVVGLPIETVARLVEQIGRSLPAAVDSAAPGPYPDR